MNARFTIGLVLVLLGALVPVGLILGAFGPDARLAAVGSQLHIQAAILLVGTVAGALIQFVGLTVLRSGRRREIREIVGAAVELILRARRMQCRTT